MTHLYAANGNADTLEVGANVNLLAILDGFPRQACPPERREQRGLFVMIQLGIGRHCVDSESRGGPAQDKNGQHQPKRRLGAKPTNLVSVGATTQLIVIEGSFFRLSAKSLTFWARSTLPT